MDGKTLRHGCEQLVRLAKILIRKIAIIRTRLVLENNFCEKLNFLEK